MCLAAIELDEHAEAASIDRLAGDLAQPVDGPLPEQRERLDVVAAQRIGALDQLERTTGPLGKDGGEGAVDDTTWSSAEGEEVRVDCFAQAHLVVGEDGVTFPQGEAARRGVVLRRDAHECPRLGDRHKRGPGICEEEDAVPDSTGLVHSDGFRMVQGQALDGRDGQSRDTHSASLSRGESEMKWAACDAPVHADADQPDGQDSSGARWMSALAPTVMARRRAAFRGRFVMEWVILGLLFWWWLSRLSKARERKRQRLLEQAPMERSYADHMAGPVGPPVVAGMLMAVADDHAYWMVDGRLMRAPWTDGHADLARVEPADPLAMDDLSPVLAVEILEALDEAERDLRQPGGQ